MRTKHFQLMVQNGFNTSVRGEWTPWTPTWTHPFDLAPCSAPWPARGLVMREVLPGLLLDEQGQRGGQREVAKSSIFIHFSKIISDSKKRGLQG